MGRGGERARHGAVGSPVSTLATGLPPASSGGCVGFWGSRPRIQLDSAPNTPNHRHEPPPPGRSRPGLSWPPGSPGFWLWDRANISNYRTSQSNGCLGFAHLSAHPLQSPSGRGCHGGIVQCFVTEFFLWKKGPTVSGSSAWRLAGERVSPLPPPSRAGC